MLNNFVSVFKFDQPSSVYETLRHYIPDRPPLEHPHLILHRQINQNIIISISKIPEFIEVFGELPQRIKQQNNKKHHGFIEYRKAPELTKYKEKGWWMKCDNICLYGLNGLYGCQSIQQEGITSNMGLYVEPLNAINSIICSYSLTEEGLKFGSQALLLKWQSQLELEYRLNSLIQLIYYSKRSLEMYHFEIILNKECILLVYNRQRMIYEAIPTYKQNKDGYQQHLTHLAHGVRFKYPLSYYHRLFESYSQIVGLVHKQLSFTDVIKLLKYSLIQNIPPATIFNHSLQMIKQVVNSLQMQSLHEDPINKTIIFYQILGMPGLHKTQIFHQLKHQLEIFQCSCLMLQPENQTNSYNNYNSELLCSFMNNSTIFDVQRHAFVLVDLSFTQQLLNKLVKQIELNLPHTIYYEYYLIIPDRSQQHYFKEEHLASSISYLFPIETIISCLLAVQSRKNHNSLNGNGVDSLAKMLHYISSVYGNCDVEAIVTKTKGNIQILQYSTFTKTNLSEMNEYDIEEIEDGLRVLLQLSYKGVYEKDALMYYFLDNIEKLDHEFMVEKMGDFILSSTFKSLPYFDFL